MMVREALLSEIGLHRYKLYRQWHPQKPTVLWVMLNPSYGDDNVDDRTMRRCLAFSMSWGFGALFVGNLFGYRTPYPANLAHADDPDDAGPGNAPAFVEMASISTLIGLG